MSFFEDRKNAICVILASVLPFGFSFFYFVLASGSAAPIIYSISKVFVLLWPLICYKAIFKRRLPKLNLTNPNHYKSLCLGLVFGVVVFAFILILMQTGVRDIVFASAENIRQKAVTFGVLRHYVLFSLALSVFHSLLEEYYWRWFVFGHMLGKMKLFNAFVLSALAFSAHHFVVISQYFPLSVSLWFTLGVFVGGLILNYLYYRQKTLFGSWLAHMFMDLAIMYVGYLLIVA
jgi:CAAX protease family protein